MTITLDGTLGITSPAETVQGALTTTGNTILGDATTDTLNVGAGGLVKDASGNVGIGTASPAVKLDVNGSAYVRAGNILGLYNTDNTNQYQIYNGGSSGANIGQLVFVQGGIAERMRIDSSGRVTTPFQPMFSGYKSVTQVAGPAVYILDTMNTNVGSVYSTSTGRFTAPVAGKYLFTSNITSSGAVTRTFAFYVNGVSTVTGIHENSGGAGYFSSIPVDGILTLSASDYVEFYIVNGAGYAGGAYRGFFSGSLIG